MALKRAKLLEDTLFLPLGVHFFVLIIVGIDVYYLTNVGGILGPKKNNASKNNDNTFLWIIIKYGVLVVSFKIRYGFALCLLIEMEVHILYFENTLPYF
jgi:hypothetical protein